MAQNKGKEFEEEFEKYWTLTFPGDEGSCVRLHDQMTGYMHTSKNPCDYICYRYPRQYMIECKEIKKGGTLNWSSFPQYERLLEYKSKKGVVAGVLIWYRQFDTVVFVGINDCEKMHLNGLKSINIKDLNNPEYRMHKVAGQKIKVYIRMDFTDFEQLPDNL